MPAAGRSVKLIASLQGMITQLYVALDNINFFAARMDMGRDACTRLES